MSVTRVIVDPQGGLCGSPSCLGPLMFARSEPLTTFLSTFILYSSDVRSSFMYKLPDIFPRNALRRARSSEMGVFGSRTKIPTICDNGMV